MEIFIQKPLVVGKLSLFLGMWNDALMHREGLKGYLIMLIYYDWFWKKHDASFEPEYREWAPCPVRSDRQTTSLPVADNWIDEDESGGWTPDLRREISSADHYTPAKQNQTRKPCVSIFLCKAGYSWGRRPTLLKQGWIRLLEWGLIKNIFSVWPKFDLWHECCFNVGTLSTTPALHSTTHVCWPSSSPETSQTQTTTSHRNVREGWINGEPTSQTAGQH